MNDGRTAGLSLGIHAIGAPGVSISGEDINGAFETYFGAGFGATVAYGFTRTFSAFGSIDLAKQQTAPDVEPAGNFGLLHVQAGARANLPLGGLATVPYVSASVGRRALGARVTDLDTGESYDSSLFGRHVRGSAAACSTSSRRRSPSTAVSSSAPGSSTISRRIGLEFGSSGIGASAGLQRVLESSGGATQLGLGMTWRGASLRAADGSALMS